ncbi:helix-turn-helix domain-containing protein [Streptomyces subrutilus]|uniref:helix-turn-helix domain-containing protein n=1 Tax=Streptomyces subrutilus TaxID=36818 RepID=UPI003437DC3B
MERAADARRRLRPSLSPGPARSRPLAENGRGDAQPLLNVPRGGAQVRGPGRHSALSGRQRNDAELPAPKRAEYAPSVSKELALPARLPSIPAVAALLDVDRRTVYRFIAAGYLPIVDLRTGPERSRVRVPAAGLDEFIRSRAIVPAVARR